MHSRSQTIALIVLIIASLSLTKIGNSTRMEKSVSSPASVIAVTSQNSQTASFVAAQQEVSNTMPARNWSVLDPDVHSKEILIEGIDSHFPFFHLNTYTTWPMASLTKLLTAVVILEDVGQDANIPVSESAVATEGEAGDLTAGEIYLSGDLLKIMLLTSSNDAAAAFEEYEGKEKLVGRMRDKAKEIGMINTSIFDGSGLSDDNRSTPTDMLRLTEYILKNQPIIFNWTRLQEFLVQPTNRTQSRTVQNIDPLSHRADFLGGKTGTSPLAQENLVSLFSWYGYRMIVIVMGSQNRFEEVDRMFQWMHRAYYFPKL